MVITNKSLIFSGGWNSGFTSQTGYSKIDGSNVRNGVYIYKGPNPIGPTVEMERFFIQNSYNIYSGGGIIVSSSTLVMTESAILNNNSAQGDGIDSIELHCYIAKCYSKRKQWERRFV